MIIIITYSIIMQSHFEQDFCDNIIKAFHKCNTEQNSYTQDKCNKIKLLLFEGNLTFMELYLKCYEKTKPTKYKIL